MKTAFVSVVTYKYVPYLKVMLHSMFVNSGLADGSRPIYIFMDDSVDYRVKAELKLLYPHINYMLIDVEKWNKAKKTNPKYWSLSAFGEIGQSDYDQVIYLDSDLVFIEPVPELLEMNMDLGMVHENSRECFNAGLMVIGKKNRGLQIKTKLMDIMKPKDGFGHDQWIINDYFRGRITTIPTEYNTMIPEIDVVVKKDNVRILHFIYKPEEAEPRTRIPQWCLNHYDTLKAEAERKINENIRFNADL